jgi:hypothetical protein
MKKLLCLMGLALLLALPAAASPVAVGQPLPTLTLQDQHGQDWRIQPDTRLVLLAAGRTASNTVLTVLGGQPKGFLASQRAVYLADMSRMPGFITRTFALPALREQPFVVGVSMQDNALNGWPTQTDSVTLLELEQQVVRAVRYAKTEAELRAALGLSR